MTIRVARVITRLNVGGPAYQAVLLNHLLQSRGYETLLIAGQCDRHEASFEHLLEQFPAPTVFCSSLQRAVCPRRDAAALTSVARTLCRFRPDIVHTHTAKAGLVGRLAGKVAGAQRLVHTFHGHVFTGYFSPVVNSATVSIERALGRITDRLVAVSDRLRDDLVERFKIVPPDKCCTIELGLPLARFLELPASGHWRSRLRIDDDAIVLGALGRLVKIKNFARLINVVAELVKLFPKKKLHLIIGGVGPLASDLWLQINRMDLAGCVHMVGLVRDLPSFYADIDLAVLTSDNEGTPVMLLEAQAAGKFVVAGDVGGVADIIGPRCGIVVAPNTVDAYVQALKPLLAGSIPTLGQAERSAVVRRFSPERLVDDIDQMYRGLVGARKPSAHV